MPQPPVAVAPPLDVVPAGHTALQLSEDEAPVAALYSPAGHREHVHAYIVLVLPDVVYSSSKDVLAQLLGAFLHHSGHVNATPLDAADRSCTWEAASAAVTRMP